MNRVRGAASLAAGAALGITVAQAALPAIADTLHPTAWGTILVTVFGALLSASLQRGRDLRSHRRALMDSLPGWPPPLLADADLVELGVYPAAEPQGSPLRYVERTPDGELRDVLRALRSQLEAAGDSRLHGGRRGVRELAAQLRDASHAAGTRLRALVDRQPTGRPVAGSWHVVVHGPPGCGKSRAAAEAAKAILPDVPAIIPVDADALRGLADAGVTLDVPGAAVCLWLDGLDRFVDALDRRGLRTLDEVKERVLIVATIRTEQWEQLIGGTGQSSDVVRALAHQATVVRFDARDQGGSPGGPPAPDTSQASDTGRPADTSQASVTSQAADTSQAPDTGPPGAADDRPRPRSRRRWELPALAEPAFGVAVLAMAAIFATAVIWRSHLVDPPPLDSQMNAIRDQMLAAEGPAGGHVVVDEQVHLHDTAAPSWVIVVEQYRDHDAWSLAVNRARTDSPLPLSDELRIYDVVNGRLRLEFDYRPGAHGRGAAGWQPLIGADAVDDFAQDGSDQLIAAYGQPNHGYESLLPFGVGWNQDQRAYRLVTLTAEQRNIPSLTYTGPSPALRMIYDELYTTPGPMYNSVADPRFRYQHLFGYRVGAFAYDPGDATRPPRLLTGYLIRYSSYKQPLVLAVHASQFRAGSLTLAPCTPANDNCPAPAATVAVRVPPAVSTDHALLLAWSTIDTRWDTPVTIVAATPRPKRSARPGARRRART